MQLTGVCDKKMFVMSLRMPVGEAKWGRQKLRIRLKYVKAWVMAYIFKKIKILILQM